MTYREILDAVRSRGGRIEASEAATLAAAPADVLDDTLRAFANEHGEAALAVLTTLGATTDRGLRRAAKRTLYRLAQRGVAAPLAPPPPVVERRVEHPTRAWVSGIDGSGSRALWILFEGGLGGAALCSLIINDTVGVVDAAGGGITKKRLEHELAALRASQKLPWVSLDPARAVGLVAEALARHRALGTAPPSAFQRWRRLFDGATPTASPEPGVGADEPLVTRTGELLERPEMAGWFLEPESVQSEAVELLQARESRLVVSDKIKAEREEAILARVIERELGPETRQLWARRFLEMALVFEAAGEPDAAALAGAAGRTLGVADRDPRAHPAARGLAQRALEVAGEVAVGRLRAADVSRKATASGVD